MKKFTLIIGMLAIGSIVFSQQLTQAQHRLSKMTDTPAKSEAQKNKRDVIGAGDIIFSETFDSTLWHTANNDGVAVPANMPNGWTAFDNTGNNFFWRWSTTGPRGAYSSNPWNVPSTTQVIKSTSDNTVGGEKGFMILEADFYNTTSEGTMADPEIGMDTYIKSRAIETTENPAVSIYFEQWHRFCCANYSADAGPKLFVSNDNINWTRYDIHQAAVNATPKVNPGVVEISISEVAAAQSTVYLRFHLLGESHYFWLIDDVTLYEPVPYDIRVKDYFADYGMERLSDYTNINYPKLFSAAPYYSPYYAFQEFITSRAILQNYGAAAFPDAQIRTRVVKGENILEEKLSAPPVTIALGAKDSFEITHNYQIPNEIDNKGAYFVEGYALGSVEDEMEANNHYRYDFNITENVFGYADPATATTDRQSPFSYVGSADGDGVGIEVMFNEPTENIPGTSIPAPYVLRGVNVHINNDGYNWDIWEAGDVGYLTAEVYEGNLVGDDYEYDMESPVISSNAIAIDSNMVNTWVYLPFVTDGASENITPTAEGHRYFVLIRFVTNGLRFFIGADKMIQPTFYANMINLGNDPGWTGMTANISMELVADKYAQDPRGTARIIVLNKNPETGVTAPAAGVSVKFYTQDIDESEVNGAVVLDLTTDNEGKVEVEDLRSGTYAAVANVIGSDNKDNKKRTDVTVQGAGVSERTIIFEVVNIENQPALSGVKLYPVPSNNTVTIESPATVSRIVVSNIVGQVVQTIENPTQLQTISVANYATGIYMVTLFDNNGNSTTQRLIKQ